MVNESIDKRLAHLLGFPRVSETEVVAQVKSILDGLGIHEVQVRDDFYAYRDSEQFAFVHPVYTLVYKVFFTNRSLRVEVVLSDEGINSEGPNELTRDVVAACTFPELKLFGLRNMRIVESMVKDHFNQFLAYEPHSLLMREKVAV